MLHKTKTLTPLLLLLAMRCAAQTAGTADIVLHNANVHTPAGFVKALAIRNGVIIASGTEAEATALRGNNTQLIDLHGRTVFPGLHDLHVHPLGAGMMQQQCIFAQGSSREQLLATLAQCVQGKAKGEWISGGQWDATSFGDEPMHRAMLDAVAPDNPVSLVDISGHSLWVNSQALALAGIDDARENPAGGIIERGADGSPTGVLRESAAGLVRGITPPANAEQTRNALQWALDQMVSQGITSITDAGVDASGMQAYAELADAGLLKLHVQGCMMLRGGAFGRSDNGIPAFIVNRQTYARDNFNPDCLKIALDGVPTDGHTAAMVEPYEHTDHLGAGERTGLLMVPQQTLNDILVDADAQGFTVKMHAAGDGAVRAGLDAIAAARQTNGFSGQLHNVAHNSFVQPQDLTRARGIAATFEMSPYIWFPNPIIPDIDSAVGSDRMLHWIPVKGAIDGGALVVPGSDWPVVPSFNPWVAIETLVTRQVPGGGGEMLGAAERITLQQAVEMFTVNAARQLGHRDRLGSLETGMLADLIILDRNPFDVPITDVHNTAVRAVMINGEWVSGSPE